MATYAYLIDPNKQYITKSGTINTAGILRVFDASTDDPVITYKDFMGTENEEAIVLDNNGRAIVIADSDKAYRLEVYDRYNTLQWTVTPLWCQAGGGGASIARTDIVSSDGTVEITKTTVGSTTTFDLSTDVEDSTDLLEWIRCEGNEIHDGVYVPLYVGGTMEVLDDGIGMYADRYYHVTAHIKCNKPVTLQPFYDDVKVHFVGRDIDDPTNEFTFQSFKLDVDYTMAMPQVFEVSTDIISLNDFELLIKIDDVEISGATFEVSDIVVHRVFSGMPALPGGAASKPWVEGNFQEKLIPGTGITIDENNVISATAAQQKNADWDATSGVEEILNKPDLSVYATKEEVTEGLAGKQDTLIVGENITIVDNVISATAEPQRNSDWNANSGVEEILNKPDLSVYATKEEVDEDLSGKQDTLTPGDNITIVNNVISATAEPQVNADWDATSGVSEILNKPDLSIYAEKTDLDDYQPLLTPGEGIVIENNVISVDGGTFTQVNSDWEATSGVAEILHKPDLSVYATKEEVSEDLSGKQDTLTPGDNITIVNNVISANFELFEAQYGVTSYSDIADAVNSHKIVYCRMGAAWGDSRMAFLAYDAHTSANHNFEFQYYRSNSSSSGYDSIFVYKVYSNNTWETIERVVKAGNISYPVTTVNVNGSSAMSGTVANITVPDAQVNSDWNASTGVQAILNKPDLSQYATQSDLDDKQDVLTAGANITIENNVISAAAAAQVNSDWDATSGVSEILNKPDLSIYAEKSELATVATTGDYDDLLNKPTITQPVNADWNSSTGLSEILNKPDLSIYATKSELSTVATTGDYDDLLNKPTITQPVNADWNSSAGLSEILNKPDLSIYAEKSELATVATTGSYNDLTDKPSIVGQVNSDWLATSGVEEILNKPNEIALVAGQNITLTKEGNELTISAQGGGGSPQVNSDWNATSGVAMILNKPVEANVIAGDNITITESGSTITISATAAPQQNADWNATSGVQEILNKPAIPSGAQLVPAATSADADKVLTVDAQGTPAWASAQAPISAGTGIDITNNVVSVDTSVVATQTDLASKQDTLTAGTNVSITNNVISATDTTYSAGTGIDITNNEISVETPVDIVAGPGIVIDNPDGNTLRVSVAQAEEVVLCNTVSNSSCTLSEAYSNFERIRISFTQEDPSTIAESYAFTPMTAEFYCADIENNAGHKVTLTWSGLDGVNGAGSNNLLFRIGVWRFTTSTTFAKLLGKQFYVSWTGTDTSKLYVTKVVGIHRIANN